MSIGRELDLLADLAKLLKRYGPEPFESLASLIKTPEISQRLADLLTHAASIARAEKIGEKTVKGKRKIASVRESLLAIKTSQPQKYEMLIGFYDDLIAGRILLTMREVRSFISDLGLPEIRQTSRQKSINPLIRSLLPLPMEELNKVTQAVMRQKSQNRGLEGWSNLILGKKTEAKE